MTLRKPSMFFRLLVLGAQGVFYNLFCVSPFLPSFRGMNTNLRTQSYHILCPPKSVIDLWVTWKKKL